MTRHPDRETLFFLFDDPESLADDPSVDPAALLAHVRQCVQCGFDLEAFRALMHASTTADLRRFTASFSTETERHSATVFYQGLAAEVAFCRQASADADLLMPQLLAAPFHRWQAIIRESPERCTYVLVARILEEAENQLDRRPADALPLLEIADRVGADLIRLPPPIHLSLLGDLWRLRASVFRHLSRFDESLTATCNAESIYSHLRCSDFPIARAWLARAETLFGMTRLSEALDLNAKATAVLRAYGRSLPFAKALMLEAEIRLEQGEMHNAQRLWDQALLVLAVLEYPRERAPIQIARCHARLAECNFRLHHYPQAIEESRRAVARYRSLRMESEAVRSSWTLALAQLHSGHAFAIDNLETAASEFESFEMYDDADFVRLDIVEALLQRGEHERAEPLAHSLLQRFTEAGDTVANVQVLEYLRKLFPPAWPARRSSPEVETTAPPTTPHDHVRPQASTRARGRTIRRCLAPDTPQLLIHFNYCCHLFGAVDFDQFIALWHAADVTLRHEPPPAYVRYHIPDLRITTTAPHITLIRQQLEKGSASEGVPRRIDQGSWSLN
jgi:tetratricopeptide (TPR) repeat protein